MSKRKSTAGAFGQELLSIAKRNAAPFAVQILEFLDRQNLSVAERVIVAEAVAHKMVGRALADDCAEGDIELIGRLGVQLASEIQRVSRTPSSNAAPSILKERLQALARGTASEAAKEKSCSCAVFHDDVEHPPALKARAAREARKALKRIVNDP